MSGCEGRELLIQADLDGELDVASAAALAEHVRTCPACAALQAQLATLSTRLRDEVPRSEAPTALREALAARLAQAQTARSASVVGTPAPLSVGIRPAAGRQFSGRWYGAMGFGAGAALAAMVAVALLPRGEPVTDQLIESHIRALQPGHLMDVVSTDQHTVKPWFNGRIDYSPPVKDLATEGFPLIGGRLDAVGTRTVAALVYRSDRHIIDLFVWPESGGDVAPPESRDGFNVIGWTRDGMVFRAVSDVELSKLADFVRRWQSAP